MIVNNPFLPDKTVKTMICDRNISKKCQKSLNECGINIIRTIENNRISASISSHPDMLIFCQSDVMYIDKGNIGILQQIVNNEKIIVEYDFGEGAISYPEEAALNGALIGECIICNKKTFKPDTDNYKTINVKQGYTKCAMCIVDESSVITEDEGIYKELIKYDFDVLLLNSKEVALKGYDHGFIGGASGKLDKNTVAFTGDIRKHSEYAKIKSFLMYRSIECVSLSDEPLYDYGTLLAIEEND